MPRITVNGASHEVNVPDDTPLLYVLMNDLELKGPRFGCGLAQCGSCSVLVDGAERRSCVTPISAVEGQSITTLEGLPALYAEQNGLSQPPEYTPVQQAILDEQAAQCGYCYNGMIVKASELLVSNPDPSAAEIKSHMNGHICRCGTYPRIVQAIQRAALVTAENRTNVEVA